jgi:hypothetical protein
MNRLELPLFPIMLVLSVVVHGAAFIFLHGEPITPPQLIPSQPGVASIKLVSSDSSRTQPTEKPTDLLADLPILDEFNTPPMVDPKLARPTQRPMDRPRERDPTPRLTSETKIVTPTEVPELTADLVPRVTTPLETAKLTAPKEQAMERPRAPDVPTPKLTADHKIFTPAAVPDLRAELTAVTMPLKELVKPPDPLKPISMSRPKTEKAELPKLEAVAKVADLIAKPSPAADQSAGVVELPEKLAFNEPPGYPSAANGRLGTVTFLVAISAEGRVGAISIYESSGV